MVSIGQKKELKELELFATAKNLQIRADHSFGISIISLTMDDAMALRDDIDQWLSEAGQRIKRDAERIVE
ncbi:MAG: hypothetical protein ACYCQJ_01160 [Nitrososphaerales archaeon]